VLSRITGKRPIFIPLEAQRICAVIPGYLHSIATLRVLSGTTGAIIRNIFEIRGLENSTGKRHRSIDYCSACDSNPTMKLPPKPISTNEDTFSADSGSGSEKSGEKSLPAVIRGLLASLLSYIPRAMKFAYSGSCPIEVNPAIFIPGLGVIGLPLSERDAKLVSYASHPAPLGEGEVTVVDPTIRKTIELNAEQFELRNPKWGKAIKAIVCKVATELDVPGGAASIRAVLHKMLLSGEGTTLKDHREYVCLTYEKLLQYPLTSYMV
jgi:hypothetical protein